MGNGAILDWKPYCGQGSKFANLNPMWKLS
jgi:hypothetical protein